MTTSVGGGSDQDTTARTTDPAAMIMVALGSGCVLLGGLVAAATGPLRLENGSWLAAYLVLVCGVGTRMMGTARTRPTRSARSWIQLGCWVLGNAAVITGTVAATPIVVAIGVLPLLITLIIALLRTVPAGGDHNWSGPRAELRTGPGWRLWAYRGVLAVLLISAPIGVLLSYLRHGG